MPDQPSPSGPLQQKYHDLGDGTYAPVVETRDERGTFSVGPAGVAVGTSAVPVLAANADRIKALFRSVGSTAMIYLGKDNTVTTSGATIGIPLGPGDLTATPPYAGEALVDTSYTGAWWAISTAISQTLSVSEISGATAT